MQMRGGLLGDDGDAHEAETNIELQVGDTSDAQVVVGVVLLSVEVCGEGTNRNQCEDDYDEKSEGKKQRLGFVFKPIESVVRNWSNCVQCI